MGVDAGGMNEAITRDRVVMASRVYHSFRPQAKRGRVMQDVRHCCFAYVLVAVRTTGYVHLPASEASLSLGSVCCPLPSGMTNRAEPTSFPGDGQCRSVSV